MTQKVLILSTPDIRSDSVLEFLASQMDFSFNPMLADHSNLPTGEIENTLIQLNQTVRESKSKSWFQPLTMTSEELNNPENKKVVKEITDNLSDKQWQLHDPFLLHTLPLWLSEIEDTHILFYYSSPLECATALQRSWRFPISFGLALWEYYVIKATSILQDKDVLLLSRNKLAKSTKGHLSPILKNIGLAQPSKWSDLAIPSFSLESEGVYEDQQKLFKLLEKGNLTSISKLKLSDSSLNNLEYYGQLRAGFERIKDERDDLLDQLNKQQKQDSEPEQVATLSTDNDPSICKVTVFLDNADPMEFYSDPQSPVLDMLQDHLVNNETDQLLFLNCGEQGTETVYFMSSSLLGINTSPVAV